MKRDRILVVGDSHSCFWGGKNIVAIDNSNNKAFAGVDILHIGPYTAHNLASKAERNKAREAIEDYLLQHQDVHGCVIFCFGEIDCRAHIVKAAIQKDISIDDASEESAERYFGFIEFLTEKYDIPGIIWGPIPSSPPNKFAFNPNYPAVGSIVERNYATLVFNRKLTSLADHKRNIRHVDIFDDLIDGTLVTRSDYLFDGCHLSNIFLSEAAARIRSALLSMELPALLPAMTRVWPVSPKVTLRNVAARQEYKTSSRLRDIPVVPFWENPSGKIFFHTDIEESPYMTLILDGSYFIERIRIHNRRDAHQDRARSIAVALSNNGKDFETIYAPPEDQWATFGSLDEALDIPLVSTASNRFVKIFLREKAYFHLDCVQVYAKGFTVNS